MFTDADIRAYISDQSRRDTPTGKRDRRRVTSDPDPYLEAMAIRQAKGQTRLRNPAKEDEQIDRAKVSKRIKRKTKRAARPR